MNCEWHLHYLRLYLPSNNQLPFITSISAHDVKYLWELCDYRKQIAAVQSGAACWAEPTISAFVWLGQWLLQPISRARVVFIPMALVQQRVKMKVCNRETCTVDRGHTRLTLRVWLWLLQNVLLYLGGEAFDGVFYCRIQNRAWSKQTATKLILRATCATSPDISPHGTSGTVCQHTVNVLVLYSH